MKTIMFATSAGFSFELGGFRGAFFAVDHRISVPKKRARL
jgi:hypothetical protein